MKCSNGYKDIDGESSIFNLQRLVRYNQTKIEKKKSLAEAAGISNSECVLIIGVPEEGDFAIFYAMDPGPSSGEWRLFDYDEEEGLEGEFPNFYEFLKATIKDVREAEGEEGDGMDLLDMEF